MKVCIAEKPSVAQSIAAVIGAATKHDGYYEGNGYAVTWTFGHLCTLKAPDDYNPVWKSWRMDILPMFPHRFGIKLIDNKGIRKQFQIIRQLYSQAEEIINCGDAGQEGELIQRWVIQKSGARCPVSRLWISSLTDEAIREGFKNLRPQAEFDHLYEAGLSRSIGDWLLGMNATRAYTLRYGQQHQVLSIGRVQTPTLALIVNRELEISRFKPTDYWELKTTYRDNIFSSLKGKFDTPEQASEILEKISKLPFTITSVKEKQGKEAPPRLFDLTSLQVECNRKYAFSAEDTLKTIQSLYEKKLTTYPRVDTTYLSDDIYPKCPEILKRLKGYEKYTTPLLGKKLPKSKKIFDNKKITDHHAIIPTGTIPNGMAEMEQKVYDLVARRFIAVFYPECTFSTTTVNGESGGEAFKTSGKQIINPAWRILYTTENTGTDEEKILPEFQVGESGPHTPDLQKKQTQAPKHYTEATLLRTMETAGKLIDNDELRDALKENGIGRPSTRAAIIETLFKRGYIHKEKKNLVATPTGIELIGTIRDELLKSAELTGQWESRLRKIERGEYQAAEFIRELKKMVWNITWRVRNDIGAHKVPLYNK